MQTFLPYENFELSARVLDRQRLGKQRVETMQIMKAIADPTAGWQNHPATKMWRDNPGHLLRYQEVICHEWTGRGYKDTCLEKTALIFLSMDPQKVQARFQSPSWLGDPALHASHRSNLLRKDPDHYGQFGWAEPDDLPYVWPV